jgi:acetolactate synthase I/III small subunit
LVLVKVNCPAKDKTKLENLVDKYVAKIVQRKNEVVIVEAVDEQEKIQQLLEALNKFGVTELIRTGRIAMAY